MMKTAVSLTEGTSHGRMYLSGGYGGSPHGALPYKTVTAMKEKKKSTCLLSEAKNIQSQKILSKYGHSGLTDVLCIH